MRPGRHGQSIFNTVECHRQVHLKRRCVHQIEIEVFPASAQLYFSNERYTDPMLSHFQFGASVYNGETNAVVWDVVTPNGTLAAGRVSQEGLYTAPPKGGLPSGTTEIVVARAVDDPTRQATAVVTLVGDGPEPPPVPKIEIYPKTVSLYYVNDNYPYNHNNYIDSSNKRQLFRAAIRNSDLQTVHWEVESGDGSIGYTSGRYTAPATGANGATATIRAWLSGSPTTVEDRARVVLHNYTWPDIDPSMDP